LPHGLPGDLLLEKTLAVAEPFAERLRRRLEQSPVAREVDRSIGDFRVQGLLQGLRPAGRLQYRFGKLKARDRLAAWVGHLVLNILAPDGIGLCSEFLAEDCTLRLEPVADAEEILQGLLQLRWQGLCRPLAFFPETARAWVDSGERGSAFWSAWDSGYNPAAESLDAAVAIAFRGLDPIGAEFERNAEAILRPLLEHRTEIKAAEDL
jgi:exodeoxyribonuclease V gamma subunit